MRLAPVDLHSIKLGVPLPFSLADSRGVLLAQKGFIFDSDKILMSLANHGNGFFVDFSDLSDPQVRMAEKAYVKHMLSALKDQKSLGELTKVQVGYSNGRNQTDEDSRAFDWLNMVELCNAMLRTRDSAFFNHRLNSIVVILAHQLSVSPDQSLLALFYLSERDTRFYSATHCLLVCAVCYMTASSVLAWPEPDIDLLMRCALTMNIGNVDLQDKLATQKETPDISQALMIREHCNLSAQTLELFGVQDKTWLSVVSGHHLFVDEPLKSAKTSERLVGLIQRVDSFSAKLSIRVSREAQNVSVAMKSIYFDAESKLDAMGAAIIKAVGIHYPGSFVKLASGEVAIVVCRGNNTAHPIVAVVLQPDGVSSATMAVRNTATKKYAVVANVPSANVNVTLNLEAILNISSAV